MPFSVFTDTSANLPTLLAEQLGITVIPFSYYIDGNEFSCLNTDAFDGAAFYGAIRRGTEVTTSLINPQRYCDRMRPALEAGQDILFVGMSSGISGSFGAGRLAAAQLREEFPDRRIEMVDTLGASLGEGLLAVRAAELRDEGVPLAEAAGIIRDLIPAMCQVFTVDDLMHLRRTGRLSNAAAVVATVLNIKPLLKGNENGNIVSFAKVRGRRRSIEAIADQYDQLVENAAEQTVGIAHADCREDVDTLVGLLRRNHPPRDFLIVDYEPVTGSHVGPGTLALFFLGSREFRGKK